MIDLKAPVYNTIIIFLLIIIILVYTKPKFLYNKDNTLKSFGCGKNKTLFNLPVVSINCGVMFYFIFSILAIISQ